MRTIFTIGFAATMVATVAAAEDVLPSSVMYEDGAVRAALTDTAGSAENGRKVFASRKLGNCLACHANEDLAEQSFHGQVGPPLNGVAERWSEAELRGIVSNSKMMFEGTIMPAFYKDTGYTRPLKKFDGKSILSAQQVEDVVAYLMTLNEI